MSEIKRYDMAYYRDPTGAPDCITMTESRDGDYVRYSDHIAAIEELTRMLSEAKADADHLAYLLSPQTAIR